MIHINITKQLHGNNGDMNLDISLKIQQGDFVAITGKSGSGKTTLLRIIAGLEQSSGSIQVGDTKWLDYNHFVDVQKRNIGFVFQDYALFPNMTVEQNLLFVKNDPQLAQQLLKITDLDNLKKRLPNNLSGGQKQRVSLCRAMMSNPKLLLLDEPFSALDLDMKNKLQNEILLLHKKFKTTIILVSHDPSEIYKLANRVIVLNHGKIINDGTPKDIFIKQIENQGFSFKGKIIDIIHNTTTSTVVVEVDQQLIEIPIATDTINFQIGELVTITTQSFNPKIEKIPL